MSSRQTLSVAAAAALLAAGAARSDTKSASFDVTATVAKTCTIAATSISLGTYDPLATAALSPSTGKVSVRCTKNTPYSIALDDGANFSVTRRMLRTGTTQTTDTTTTTEYLGYKLYSDAQLQMEWNNASPVTGKTTTSLTSTDLTVYAQIPPTQDVPEGTYKDTVNATINF